MLLFAFFLSLLLVKQSSSGMDTQVLSRNLTCTSVLLSGTVLTMQGQSGVVMPLTQTQLQETVILDDRQVTLRPRAA